MTQIKICGLTSLQDVAVVNTLRPEYIGIVLFYPKSHRSLEPEAAGELIRALHPAIRKVAVMVSPDASQIEAAQSCGFDMIQFHGSLTEDAYRAARLPLIKAFNIDDMKERPYYDSLDKISGYVYDAAQPGSGRAFDWSMLKDMPRNGRLFVLAGGLRADNVAEAISCLHPDIVDVSSSVENDGGRGKSPERAGQFVHAVRQADSV